MRHKQVAAREFREALTLEHIFYYNPCMNFLPRHLRRDLKQARKKEEEEEKGVSPAPPEEEEEESRNLPTERQFMMAVQSIALREGATEEHILFKLAKSGWEQLFKGKRTQEKLDSLTDRELEVLEQVWLGKRNYQIAETLDIAFETVKSHLQNIFAKFNLRSRRELRSLLKDWPPEEWRRARHK
jgi:DNA-binding CsgD family transcriptional regulator